MSKYAPRATQKRIPVRTRLEPNIHTWVEKQAALRDITVSAYINQVLASEAAHSDVYEDTRLKKAS